MKKTYSNPTLKVVNVKVQHLMAGSGENLLDNLTNGDEITLDAGTGTATAGGNALSKDNSSMWDED